MNHKKTIIWGAVLVVVSVIGVLIFFSIEKNKTPAPVETPKVSQEKPAAPEKPEPKETPKQVSKNVQKVEPKKTEVKKYVYENSSLPFSVGTLTAISCLGIPSWMAAMPTAGRRCSASAISSS